MEYEPQEWFYLSNQLSKNWALYLREKGSTDWIERPVPESRPLDPDKEGVPLYGDYIADPTSVFTRLDRRAPLSDPIDVEVKPVSPLDPLPQDDTQARLLPSLRHHAVPLGARSAGLRAQPALPNSNSPCPAANDSSIACLPWTVRSRPPKNGAIAFRYVATDEEFEALRQPRTLQVELPSLGIDEERSVCGAGLG